MKKITRDDLRFVIEVAEGGLNNEEEKERYDELKSIIQGNDLLNLF